MRGAVEPDQTHRWTAIAVLHGPPAADVPIRLHVAAVLLQLAQDLGVGTDLRALGS